MSHTRALTITALCGLFTTAGATALVGCSADARTSDDPTPTAEEAVSGAPLKVSPGVSAISEAGDSAFFSVTLGTRPRGRVVVNVRSSDPSEARVFPSRITFNPHDWNKPRTITVQSIEDDDFDGDIPIQLVFAPVQSTDRAFSGYRHAPIDVLSVDDDYVVTGYRVHDHLAPGIVTESRVAAINNRGQVAGDFYNVDGVVHAFLWDSGQITDLGSLGGGQMQSHALDINDAGVVLGWSDTLEGVQRFLYQNGQLAPTPGEVWAINDRGHTVGDVLYAGGRIIDIPDLSQTPAVGLALNDRDSVTGYAQTPSIAQNAFFWDGRRFTDLGSFGGPRAAGLSVNEHDQVVGRMFDAQFTFHPFLYEDGQITNLGTVTGTPGGVASSINNRGDIVGSDQEAGEPVNGWVGTPGNLRSLTSLLVDGTCWFVIAPLGVNDAGYIAANARGCVDTTLIPVVLEPIKVSK
jgi:probable HAF family extracellular repeat protein